MSAQEITTMSLPVIRKTWLLRLRNDRRGRRGRPEDVTIRRWIDRWVRRTRDTIAGYPYLEVAAIGDDFLRNQEHLRIDIPRLIDGQTYGLPAVCHVNAAYLDFFPTVNGRPIGRDGNPITTRIAGPIDT